MFRRARGAWWCVSKATSCRLWRKRYNLQGDGFGVSQLKIVKRGMRLFCPCKMVRLPEEPIKGESLFAELAYEAAKRR
jgi:hypothetical protein